MELPNPPLKLSMIDDPEETTRKSSECRTTRSESFHNPPFKIAKSSSEGDLTMKCSYEVAVESMRRNSLEEVSECMQNRLNAEAESILEHGEVVDENSLKKKTFLMNMFRTAVLKVIEDKSGDDFEGVLAPLADDPSTNLTLLPTQKTKAIYLSQVFKYAVKQTIIDRKQEKSSGDPWDEFFFRIYSAEKPRMDNARRSMSAGIKLNLNRELQDKLNLKTYDQNVKDKLTPYRSSSSGTTDRGKRAFDNLSRISSSISKRRQQEISEKEGDEHLSRHATLPKLPPRRCEERTVERGRRFRVEKVRHSPDGRSPLSRLFYLPHIPSQPSTTGMNG